MAGGYFAKHACLIVIRHTHSHPPWLFVLCFRTFWKQKVKLFRISSAKSRQLTCAPLLRMHVAFVSLEPKKKSSVCVAKPIIIIIGYPHFGKSKFCFVKLCNRSTMFSFRLGRPRYSDPPSLPITRAYAKQECWQKKYSRAKRKSCQKFKIKRIVRVCGAS